MKYILILLIAIGLNSCTWKSNAETSMSCPCIVHEVTRIEYSVGGYDVVKIKDDGKHYLTLRTWNRNYYNVGDTIK